MGDEHVAPAARRRQVLLHQSVGGVELLDRLDVCVLFDAGDESFECVGGWHGASRRGWREG